jgi:serine/threonine protein kinase
MARPPTDLTGMKNWLSKIFGKQRSIDSRPGSPPEEPLAPKEAPAVDPVGNWDQGRELLGDLVVERTLGEGGMGSVYLVRSRATGSQFAVKRAKRLAEADRRNFLAELQIWIDLPEHPNLVPCRFFCSLEDEILIFAEYVEGGSLKEWIDTGKLYEDGPSKALERMLDVAIQFGWGLHCVHQLGLVHQDVKPGNVLMGMERQMAVSGLKPKVTDYGLARARAAGGERYSTNPGRSVVVSCGGGTPAYWSPEQAQGLPLTQKSDIWSFAVSVLEMFTGQVTWMAGNAAPEVLEQFLQCPRQRETIPPIPADIADLARSCFCQHPEERPTSMARIVDELKAIYHRSVGATYSRVLPVMIRESSQSGIGERRHASGVTWTDPLAWLHKALRADGQDPEKAPPIASKRGATRRGQLVADLVIYAEAKRLYERLVPTAITSTSRPSRGTIGYFDQLCGTGRVSLRNPRSEEWEGDLAALCMDKALIHDTVADVSGALREYDQAIRIWERLVKQKGRNNLGNDLARAYMNKAITIGGAGDHHAAVELHERAIAIRERSVHQDGQRELANDLAGSYMSKAIAVHKLGDIQVAIALFDQAIAIREELVNQEGQGQLANDLAAAYLNKANAVNDLGDHRVAVVLYEQAIAIWERLVNQENQRSLANPLALACMNKAIALQRIGDNRASLTHHDRAILLWEQLVNQEGRREFVDDLAQAYMNKAIALRALGDHRSAISLYDRGLEIWEKLVNQEGRRELGEGLASVYMNKANAASALGDSREALALYEQSIAVWERLVNLEGRRELAGDWAWAQAHRAETLLTLGEKDKGLQEMRSVQSVLESEIARTGRTDLKSVLVRLQEQVATHAARR